MYNYIKFEQNKIDSYQNFCLKQKSILKEIFLKEFIKLLYNFTIKIMKNH